MAGQGEAWHGRAGQGKARQGKARNLIEEDMAETRKRSFVLSAQQFSYLEKEAARVGIGISELLRRIIDEYRNSKTKEKKS